MKKTQIYNVPRTPLSYCGMGPTQLSEASRLFRFGEDGKKFRKLIREYRERWYRSRHRDFAKGMADLRFEILDSAAYIAMKNGISLTSKYLANIAFRTGYRTTKARLNRLQNEDVPIIYFLEVTK